MRKPRLTKEVTLGGEVFTVRALTARQTFLIHDALPFPAPPTKKDPNKGSAAPEIEDVRDPAFRAAQDIVTRERTIAEAAGAINLEVDTSTGQGLTLDKDKGAWVRPAIQKMLDEFTEAEIMALWETTMVLSGPEVIRQFIGTLVVEAPKESTAAAKVPREIPENYAYTLEALTLSVCERFGQDPATWPATLSAEQMAEYLAFERIRLHEEKVRDEILAGLLKMTNM